MKLNTYVIKQIEKTGKNKTTLLKELSAASGVSLLTLQGVERGATMRLYDKAKAVSVATHGEVSVDELCDPRVMEVSPRIAKPAKSVRVKKGAKK